MTPPKQYVRRDSFTRASKEMLRMLMRTSTPEVKDKAHAEIIRRRESE